MHKRMADLFENCLKIEKYINLSAKDIIFWYMMLTCKQKCCYTRFLFSSWINSFLSRYEKKLYYTHLIIGLHCVNWHRYKYYYRTRSFQDHFKSIWALFSTKLEKILHYLHYGKRRWDESSCYIVKIFFFVQANKIFLRGFYC